MIDFHIEIHKSLAPATAINYAKSMGLRAFALFKAVDFIPNIKTEFKNSELDESELTNAIELCPRVQELLLLQKQIHELSIYYNVQVFFGLKLMHIPPALLEKAIAYYRAIGINLIGVYGETIADIVEEGTNFNACLGKATILFNAGLIDEKCVELAKENSVFLEISTNAKHAYTNAHIAQLAQKVGAKLVLGSGAKKLEEIHSPEMQKSICKGALVTENNGYELLQILQKTTF